MQADERTNLWCLLICALVCFCNIPRHNNMFPNVLIFARTQRNMYVLQWNKQKNKATITQFVTTYKVEHYVCGNKIASESTETTAFTHNPFLLSTFLLQLPPSRQEVCRLPNIFHCQRTSFWPASNPNIALHRLCGINHELATYIVLAFQWHVSDTTLPRMDVKFHCIRIIILSWHYSRLPAYYAPSALLCDYSILKAYWLTWFQ